jgi:hypothetical protein
MVVSSVELATFTLRVRVFPRHATDFFWDRVLTFSLGSGHRQYIFYLFDTLIHSTHGGHENFVLVSLLLFLLYGSAEKPCPAEASRLLRSFVLDSFFYSSSLMG